MNKYITVQLTPESKPDSILDWKSRALDILKEVETASGNGCSLYVAFTIIIVIQGLASEAVERILAPHFESFRDHQINVTMLQRECTLCSDKCQPRRIVPGMIVRQKLTWDLLFNVPEGAFVVSNLYPRGYPAFAVRVGNEFTRPILWSVAVKAGADQRVCEVVWTEAEFEEAYNRFMNMTASRKNEKIG